MSNSQPVHLPLLPTPQQNDESPSRQSPVQLARARVDIQNLQTIYMNGPGVQDCPPSPSAATGDKKTQKSWAEKYKDLHKHNQGVIKELVGNYPQGVFYIDTNELVFNIDFNNTKLWFCTGIVRDLETGFSDHFGDDVIIAINNHGKAIFIRLSGTCSVQEVEHAFVQIGYWVNRDLFWAIQNPPVCTVHWFRPLDYETGEFLYAAGGAGRRTRTIQRLLDKWSTEFGTCHVEVRNLYPRKKKWEPATLYIELVELGQGKVVTVHDALGRVRCAPKS